MDQLVVGDQKSKVAVNLNPSPELMDEQDRELREQSLADQRAQQEYLAQLRGQQNLGRGILGGLGACLVGAALWAIITVITEYQIGWMAVGVGALVGIAVRKLGQGLDSIYGIIGGAFALLGCVLGNVVSMIGVGAMEVGTAQVFAIITFDLLAGAMVENFSGIDLLFYGLAVYEGYKLSIINPYGDPE